MPKNEPLEPPQTSGGDHAIAIARLVVSAIPYAGGPSAEVLGMVDGPYERRLKRFLADVAGRINALEQAAPDRVAALANDETFVSVFLAASQSALRASTDAKRRLLGSAVEHSAAGSGIGGEMQQVFIRYVDELTTSHVALLQFIAANDEAFGRMKSYAAMYKCALGGALVGCTEEEFDLMCTDLVGRRLLQISGAVERFPHVAEAEYIATEGYQEGVLVRVTDIGRAFLEFVNEPPVGDVPDGPGRPAR